MGSLEAIVGIVRGSEPAVRRRDFLTGIVVGLAVGEGIFAEV
jgi:hypothetical protein